MEGAETGCRDKGPVHLLQSRGNAVPMKSPMEKASKHRMLGWSRSGGPTSLGPTAQTLSQNPCSSSEES